MIAEDEYTLKRWKELLDQKRLHEEWTLKANEVARLVKQCKALQDLVRHLQGVTLEACCDALRRSTYITIGLHTGRVSEVRVATDGHTVKLHCDDCSAYEYFFEDEHIVDRL